MYSEETTNLKLRKWSSDDYFSNTDLKFNWDVLDAALGPLSSLPTEEKTSIVLSIIELYDSLKSTTDGSSGADYVKISSITGLNGNTIQAVIESFKTLFDNHVSGESNKHKAADIEYSQNVSMKDKYDNHVNGNADYHSSNKITYSGSVNKPNVKEAIDQLKSDIGTIVINASIDPEVALARSSNTKGKDFETLGSRLEMSEKDIINMPLGNYNIPKTMYKLLSGLPVTIVFAGDSIGGGAGASSEYTTWTKLVQDKLQELFPNVTFTFQNSSQGGTDTSYLKDNWDTLITPYSPDLILIYHGTNDRLLDDDVVKSNYEFINNKVSESGYEIIISTSSVNVFTPANYGNTISESNYNLIEHEAQLARDTAGLYKWGFADCNLARHKFLSKIGVDHNTTLTHFDYIHPNDLGHRIIAYAFLMVFSAGINTIILDDRYGGKNLDICDDYKTLYDLNKLMGQINEWERYGLYHQQVTPGGLWVQNEISGFKTAKLWGTDVTTGTETYTPTIPSRHIVAREKDFITFEVFNAKRVWTQLYGSSSTSTNFQIIVDGSVITTVAVSSSSVAPIEIEYSSGNKIFPKGKHTITIKRLGNIPYAQYIEFYGFVVRHYPFENKPEKDPNINRIPKGINAKDIIPTTRQIAKDNGIMYPFGYGDSDVGFVYPPFGTCLMLFKFWGIDIKVKLSTILNTENSFMAYVDGAYIQTLNMKSDSVVQNIYTIASGLSPNIEHELVLIGLKAQISLFEIMSSGTENKFGVCGTTIPIVGFSDTQLPQVVITPYYPETGKIPITNATARKYIHNFVTGNWTLNTGGLSGLDYMQCSAQNSQVKIKFHGTSLALRYTQAPTGGTFNVTIDGVDKGNVNCNNASWVLGTQNYTGLADGYHELVLTKTDSNSTIVQLYDIEQTGITVPTFQYVSSIKPSSFTVTGAGEFMYSVF